jgi:hypothetical protein
MPADAGVDEGGAGRFDRLGQSHDFIPGAAALDQIEHRQAENDDEVEPGRRPHASHRLGGKAAAVLEAAAPAILAQIGLLGDELVDQVTFRSHQLDTVVAGEPGEAGAADVVVERALDLLFGEFARADRRDRRLQGRRGDGAAMVGVAARVEDLQGDPTARLVHGIGDLAVLFGLRLVFESGCTGHHDAVLVGGDATGHDQPDTAPGAFGIESGEAGEAIRRFFEAGMHRTHQHAIAQRREAEVERRKQMGVCVMVH